MAEYEVTCINKSHHEIRHEYITHIGNTAGAWKITRENAVSMIDSKTHAFYTVDARTAKRAYVGVVREHGKAPYLRTHADGSWNDNLLAQRECDSSCRIV